MKTGEWPLGQSRREDRCLDKLRFADALAAGAVKQDRVAVRFPNRGQLHAAWPVQAKKHAARTASANQDSFGNVKGANLQFILLADGVLDVNAKLG